MVKLFSKTFPLMTIESHGIIRLPLSDYRDLEADSRWYRIGSKAQVKLNIFFLHSRTKYYDREIRETENKRKRFEVMKKAAEDELSKMKQPFWFLNQGGKVKEDRYPIFNVSMQERKASTGLARAITKCFYYKQLKGTESELFLQQSGYKINWFLWLKMLIVICSIFCFLLGFISYNLPIITICGVTLVLILDDNLAAQHHLRFILMFLVLTFVLDIIWLVFDIELHWG